MVNSGSFPVVFFDGERETSIGDITVNSSTRYNKFMAVIARRIGINPQQIAVSVVRQRVAEESGEQIRIADSTIFPAIIREEDCIFRAVLKRSTGRREKQSYATPVPKTTISKTDKVQLLRRNPEAMAVDRGRLMLQMEDFEAMADLERLQDVYMHLELPSDFLAPAGRLIHIPAGGHRLLCKECLAAREWPVPFHSCVYDAVTFGFRSKAGPVQRPKNSSST